MLTGVYFIEGYYFYTYVGSSGRGVQTSEKGPKGDPSDVSEEHLEKGALRAL